MHVLDGCGLVAEGGAVGCGLLKRSIYSNRTVSSPVSDAASHNTRFTAAPATFTTPELPASGCMQYSQKEFYENNT